MIKFTLAKDTDTSFTVLCLGSHSDDIEIGCGGTLLHLIENYENISFYWIVFSANPIRAKEAETSANKFLAKVTNKEIVIKNFKDGFFPFVGGEIKTFFEQLKKELSPDIIFTHYRHDAHQDHRQISDLTWNTFRDHLILEYEICKYDGDIGAPNLFTHLSKSMCQKKIDYILKSFQSQSTHSWFDSESFFSLLRLRGIESNSPTKYAEAFYCRKSVFS